MNTTYPSVSGSRVLLGALALLVGSVGCTLPTGASSAREPRYQLACDSSDTTQTSTLFCVRLDTSNGDVKRVDLSKVRTTAGSTMGPDQGTGAFQLVCDATDTAAQSEFHCIRLDRASGDVVVVALPKIEAFPN